MNARMLWMLLAVASCAGVAGFGGCRPAGSAPTVPASGRLVYAGRPLPDIELVFTPHDGRRGFALTDAEGRFNVSTFARGDGAVPGKHTVTLWPRQPVAAVAADSFLARPTAGSDADLAGLPFPKKYATTGDTDLIVDLGEKGARDLELVLKDSR